MSMTADAQQRLRKIIAEQLSVDEEEVVPEASFIEDLNADSLDLVELIMTLEEEFDIKISDEDAEKIQTVQDAMDYRAGARGLGALDLGTPNSACHLTPERSLLHSARAAAWCGARKPALAGRPEETEASSIMDARPGPRGTRAHG